MNYEDMTKEELIAYIKKLQARKKITYEEQMKLAILDNSPFTIWASDRDCKIRLWMGQCETLYGYKSEEVINEDFVDLFVEDDEKAAARKDQIDIIDNGHSYHNIANDIAKNANKLQLLTICRRIKDPITGEYWNAEMGLVIDFLEKEKSRLKSVVAESQKNKLRISQCVEDMKRINEGFLNRRKSIKASMHECMQKAATQGKGKDFKNAMANHKERLDMLSKKMNNVFNVYVSEIKSCESFDNCEKELQSFLADYEIISDSLEEIAAEVLEISFNYNVKQSLVSDKDTLMKMMNPRFRKLSELTNNILCKVEEKISDYKTQISTDPQSDLFKSFEEIKHNICELIENAEKSENKITQQILDANSKSELSSLKKQVDNDIERIHKEILNVECSFKEVCK